MVSNSIKKRVASLDCNTFVVRCSVCRKYCSIAREAARCTFRCGGCQALLKVARRRTKATQATTNSQLLYIGFSPEEISRHRCNQPMTRRDELIGNPQNVTNESNLDHLSIAVSLLGVVALVSTCCLICAKILRTS